MSERGALRLRLEVSSRDQRALARVRAASALVAGLGALAMLLGELPLPAFLLALLGLSVSVVWFAQARRAGRAARAPEPEALEVYDNGLWLDEHAGKRWVPWAEVCDVEVDEERLDVVLTMTGGPPLRIEPRYPGVDIHALVRTLSEARRAAGCRELRVP